ncbi:hypothetical protein GOBAR_DD36694 [Gossypium barbadense]|nr:hypothetical protein GOBAR_DD36694 [Gossypium barbadense]
MAIQIPRVKLGSQGFEVSKLGFGCMGLSDHNVSVSDEVGIAIIKHAFERGITHFDTADFYGPKTNEILVGKALKHLPREKVQLATKFGVESMGPGGPVINGTPAFMEELKQLVKEGKIKYIGISEASPETIRRAHAIHPLTAVQIEWSLWTRDAEEEIIPLCRELGIGIVPYSPPGRGFFAGKAKGDVEKLAENYGCTPAQLALSWVLHQGDDVAPIPGGSYPDALKKSSWKYGNTPPKKST